MLVNVNAIEKRVVIRKKCGKKHACFPSSELQTQAQSSNVRLAINKRDIKGASKTHACRLIKKEKSERRGDRRRNCENVAQITESGSTSCSTFKQSASDKQHMRFACERPFWLMIYD
jgi:hypothetical protein